MKHIRLIFLTAFALVQLLSCQDPTTLGTDLLSEDQARVGFSDTVRLVGRSVLSDSVRTYSDNPANQLRSYPFGRMQEPLLGLAEASIYLQVRPEFFKPDFAGAQLDSVVLVLPYDTTGVYGDLDASYGIEVYRMTEQMDRRQTYFSSASFATDPSPVGSHTFVPNLDTITVLEYVGDSQEREVSFSHLRVPLDPAFGESLLALDTTQIESDSAFLEQLNGLYLRPTLPTPGLLSFSLNEPGYLGGIYLYFQQDGNMRQFQFAVEQLSARVPTYTLDYAGSQFGPLIDDPDAGDSVLVVQGLSGLNARLDLGDLSAFEELVINKAELTLTLQDYPGNDTLVYPPAEQLLLSYETPAGVVTLISDVVLGLNNNQLGTVFGGRLDPESGTYTMNLTSHLQEVINGEVPSNLIVSLLGKPENPGRTVLYGVGHPEFGLKMRIAFTEL